MQIQQTTLQNTIFRNIVEYENGFDMNTGKLFIFQMATSHSYTDENSYA